jgi:hypothetical protein
MYASPPLGRVGQCGFGEKDVINGIRTDPCGCAYECGRAKRGDVPRVGPDTTHGMAYVGLKNGCWARKIAQWTINGWDFGFHLLSTPSYARHQVQSSVERLKLKKLWSLRRGNRSLCPDASFS